VAADCAVKIIEAASSLDIAPVNCKAILAPLVESAAVCVFRVSSLDRSSANEERKVFAVVDKLGAALLDVDGAEGVAISCPCTGREAKAKSKSASKAT